ncbi:MAG: hypothetical protein Tsb009_17540 [Planctomycetaceae bacterium]
MCARRLNVLSLSCLVVLTCSLTGRAQPVTKKSKFTSQNSSTANKTVNISSLPTISPAIHSALQSRLFPVAIKLIDAELAKPNVKNGDYLTYLKGRTQTRQGEFEKATTTFLHLEKTYPKSRWLSRSRFARADVLVRQRNYREAGKIYQSAAEQLLSNGRQEQLADIYLEFADRYFEGILVKGPTSERKPDYKQAMAYYKQALSLRTGTRRQQKIEYRIARCQQELGQYPQAIVAFRSFLKKYASEKTKDEQRLTPKREAEARYQLGRCLLAARQFVEARKVWQDLLENPIALKAGGTLIPEAAYRLAHTYGVPKPHSTANLELGVAAHEKFLARFPKHKLAATAEYEISLSYLHHGRYDQAVGRLKSLIGNPNYKNAAQVADARRLLGQAYLGQRKYAEAIQAWKQFLEAHPTDRNWSTVQRMVINTEYQMADDQRRQKNYEAARKLWKTFLNKYPLDNRAATILFQFGSMKYAEAMRKQIDELKKKKAVDQNAGSHKLSPALSKLFEEAISDWNRLVSKYPHSTEASHGSYMIGVTLEDHLAQLAEALKAYKKVRGRYQPLAQRRIVNLTEKQLKVITERKFRSHEKPKIKLRTRNLENVTVKIYRIDMVDYFRKMHLASGVETLDIALIDPDKTWEYKVANYEKYRQLTNEVEIPVDGPGLTAVTVSSDKLEATTMVIVSDIDIVVKASRNELFVFAENMRTQKPASGVSLLISDGKEVFAEEVTGQDGVMKKSYDKLKTVSDLRVFAVHQGHAASTISNLQGLKFAVGLASKGYLYTDRPAYRAGEFVHLKGIVRWVNNDVFTFKTGEKYKLDIYDARGRVIRSTDVALGKFGTFADRFVLPRYAPQGQYRVCLHQPGKNQSYETYFVVHEVKLEPVQLVVDLPRKVIYRGEKIEGRIQLKYYYGAPLAGRIVHYQLMGENRQTAVTDAKGEIKFSFESSQYNESQSLNLHVTYPERGLQTNAVVVVATRGFAIDVKTRRKVYISGETFDTTIKVTDPSGRPVGTQLKLEVLELLENSGSFGTPFDGKGEKLIATHTLKSDQETGEARHTLRIDKAGYYRLRATGTDQFNRPVSGAATIRISGEDDAVRLRILSDKHEYNVGDTARVRLHWREEPALALVTYDGAKVLGYRLVKLNKGVNALAIPVKANLAPNFVLSVTVMNGNRFHKAESEFLVKRKLNIALKTNAKTLKPGEELRVTITTTDSQGKPVSAELSLGLIEKSLLDYFGENQIEINTFFAGGYRQPSVRAFTSATFEYRPQTRGISQFLLAEAERKQILAKELANRRALAAARLGFDPSDRNLDKNKPLSELQSKLLELEETISAGVHGRDSAFKTNQPGLNPPGAMGGFGGQGFGPGGGNFNGLPSAANQSGGFANAPGNEKSTARLRGRQLMDFSNSINDDPKRLLSRMNSLVTGIKAGDGKFEQFNGKLSLVIRQSQTVHDNKLLQQLANVETSAIPFISDDGEYQVLNGLPAKQIEKLAKRGLRILPGMQVAETGYWNPLVVTGKDGKAVVTFRLPLRSTAWKLRAKGIDVDVLTGETETEIIARRELFGDVKTPLAFVEGDKATVLVDVHNSVVKKGEKIQVVLEAKFGNRSTKLTKTIVSSGPGVQELAFPLDVMQGEQVEFVLSVTSGKHTNQVVNSVPIRPFGIPVYATASGSSAQNTLEFVGHDAKLPVQNPKMEILIGPSVNRTLLDAVLGTGSALQRYSSYRNSPIERNVSDVLGGVALLKMLRATRTTDSPEAQALAGRIQSALTSLVASQRTDGGWSWAGGTQSGSPDRYLSSRVVWALSEARQSGLVVPVQTLNRSVQYLRTEFTKSHTSDRERQAILLHGLTAAGAGDFSYANRLFRERNSLSPSGLLHLALVLSKMDRKEMASQLLELVNLSTDKKRVHQLAAPKVIPWMQSHVELRALYLLALQAVKPADKKSRELAEWLMAARIGSRWQPEKANGPAIAALAEWFAHTKFTAEKYTLSVFVNGKLVENISVDPSKDGSRTLTVPDKLLSLVKGKPQQINFEMKGRGRFSYSVILSGFVAADKLKNTTNLWDVKRHYEPAARMFEGKPVPRGFGILTGGYSSFRNPLTQLPLGEQGEVSLSISRADWKGGDYNQRDYLIVTEPIPAGAIVLTESIRGRFDRYELSPGAITFYVGDRSSVGTIRYTLVGYLPGSYRAAPTVVRSFYQPDRIAVATIKPFDVLARGAKTKDKYRLTPVELYEYGKRYSDKGQYTNAAKHLTQLFQEYRLRDSVYKHVVQMLFRASQANKEDDALVKYFEILKERYPDVEVDFDAIMQVANAYRQLGEYERGYLVYRATIEASFERESQIAGFLDARGEFLRSVQVMERLLAEYPAESYVALSSYALAQEVYGKAADVAKNRKLRDAGLTRVNLIATSIRMIDHFISNWPNDPAADQASFALANALLDLENFKEAILRCETYAKRYPKSKLLDSFWYIIGYSQFALGQHQDALQMCKKVAETKRKDPNTGIEIAAANKWQAIYIMGQIYHSLGKPAEAIAEYKQVKSRFPDAREAIDFFTRKALAIPEVTTIKPGDAVKVPLSFRNIPSVSVKVYRIDLLKFGLMQRNLNRITAINLAGVRPYHELKLNLGDGNDFRDRKQDLLLPLKDEGAYLVVCRGENLYASGLAVVSPLSLEVQEDATSGRVRVTVKNIVTGKYTSDVHVKVIGSANRKFVSGETDLRGIFIADAIRGTSTIIARAEKNRYAFHRGKIFLGRVAENRPRKAPQSPKPSQKSKATGKDSLLEGLQKQNSIFNGNQRNQYRNLLKNKSRGVQIKKAFK